MKRSDFERNVRGLAGCLGVSGESAQRGLVDAAVAERESTGAVWDPESEPLPERLEVRVANGCAYVDAKDGDYILFVASTTPGTWSLTLGERSRIVVEAVRRWNAFQELRDFCLGDDGSPRTTISPEDWERRRRILAILDGRVE
jgi:hypothetical protein